MYLAFSGFTSRLANGKEVLKIMLRNESCRLWTQCLWLWTGQTTVLVSYVMLGYHKNHDAAHRTAAVLNGLLESRDSLVRLCVCLFTCSSQSKRFGFSEVT
jgi:hypothetical protein